MLDIFLALNGQWRCRVFFEIDKPFDAVSFRMARDQFVSMSKYAANEIIRHANVNCSAWSVCKNVDPAAHGKHRCLGSSLPGLTRQSIVLAIFSIDGCAGQARA